jgi:hypothetical protein
MPEFNVGDYLSNDALILHGVAGVKHPNGKTYTIAAPSAEDELRMRRIVQIQNAQAGDASKASLADELRSLLTTDGAELTVPQKLLGAAHDEMVADGVTPTHIDKLAQIVMTNFGVNEYSARMVVSAAQGEALARANRATRRAAAKSPARKRSASKPKAGTKSSPASGAKSTPATAAAASTPAPATSAPRKRAPRKTA